MYRIAICDDDRLFLETTEKLVAQYIQKHKVMATIKCYHRGSILLDEVSNRTYYDIYILDIEMPDISGTEIVRKIRQSTPDVMIMFVTNHMQYTLESFELGIFRYIPKDLMHINLPLALQAAFSMLECQEGEFYIYSNAKRIEKILYKDMIYAYKEEKNTIFVLGHREVKVREPLFEVYKKLSKDDFIQTDRCYIVNIRYICKVDSVNRKVVLKNGTALDVSKSRIQEIKKTVSMFWGAKI